MIALPLTLPDDLVPYAPRRARTRYDALQCIFLPEEIA